MTNPHTGEVNSAWLAGDDTSGTDLRMRRLAEGASIALQIHAGEAKAGEIFKVRILVEYEDGIVNQHEFNVKVVKPVTK